MEVIPQHWPCVVLTSSPQVQGHANPSQKIHEVSVIKPWWNVSPVGWYLACKIGLVCESSFQSVCPIWLCGKKKDIERAVLIILI